MLISEFSQAAGLSKDTIRFYIRRGLIVPETSRKGGRNPYQVFTDMHVRDARIIRMAQSLGMSLKEIGAINREHRIGGISRARGIEILKDQLVRLEEKAAEMNAMASYLRAKLAWHQRGDKGPEPEFAAFAKPTAKKSKATK